MRFLEPKNEIFSMATYVALRSVLQVVTSTYIIIVLPGPIIFYCNEQRASVALCGLQTQYRKLRGSSKS